MIANRLVNPPAGTVLLNIPFMGRLTVDGCDGINGRVLFDSVGTGPFDWMSFSAFPNNENQLFSGIYGFVTSSTRPQAMMTINIARETGGATRMVTIWLSWDAPGGCRFQAQAIQTPRL
jgi:hypothetical protein